MCVGAYNDNYIHYLQTQPGTPISAFHTYADFFSTFNLSDMGKVLALCCRLLAQKCSVSADSGKKFIALCFRGIASIYAKCPDDVRKS